jgi:hypothetical protein
VFARSRMAALFYENQSKRTCSSSSIELASS